MNLHKWLHPLEDSIEQTRRAADRMEAMNRETEAQLRQDVRHFKARYGYVPKGLEKYIEGTE